MCKANRAAVTALLLCCLMGSTAPGLGQEPLPTPPQPLSGESSRLTPRHEQYCPTISSPPLTALTVDIRPTDGEGKLVIDSELPANCMPASITGPTPMFMDYRPGSFDCSCRDLLQLARFCHPKLLFEDPMLERYGVDYICPSCHAVGEFTYDLLLLPARLLVYKRQPCVRTPTPHCLSACGVCGY
jgi:hypothetical protein